MINVSVKYVVNLNCQQQSQSNEVCIQMHDSLAEGRIKAYVVYWIIEPNNDWVTKVQIEMSRWEALSQAET